MSDNLIDTNDMTNQEIKDITKKQTKPIIFLMIIVILISFLITNIPRITDCNFNDVNTNNVVSMSINYNYFSTVESRYNHEHVVLDSLNSEFDNVLNEISKYEYDVTFKTFMGFQNSFSTSGDSCLITLAYNDLDIKQVKLSRAGDIQVNGISYKMDKGDVSNLIDEILNYSDIVVE